jgi:hypothetical protein
MVAPLYVPVGGSTPTDLVTIDALARLQLLAARAGFEVRLLDASLELRALLDLAGLREVLRVEP